MPVVRRAERQVGIGALPGVRKTAAATPESEGAGVALARADTGRAMAGFGETVAQAGIGTLAEIQARERRRADDVRVMAADRQLGEFELARLHDPEHGVLNTVHGPDTLGLDQRITAEFDERAGKIEQTLQPGRQREAFVRVRDDRRARLRQTLTLYASRELRSYEETETQAALANAVQTSIASVALDPARIGVELGRVHLIATQYAVHRGLGPEARAVVTSKAATDLHEGVIRQLIAQGQDAKAAGYFEIVKPQITGDRLAVLQQAVESASVAGQGLRIADAIWAEHGPQTDADPIPLDRMEAAARARAGDDTKVLEATVRYLRERKGATDAARQDRKEALAGTLWGAVARGASLDQIRKLPEYAAAPGHLQAQISEHVVQTAEHAADRRYLLSERAGAEARRREAEKEQAGWARFWEVSRPETLGAMSEDQILGLLPELGVDHVTRLMAQRRQIGVSGAAAREATIDRELFTSLAESAGLRPNKPKLTEAEKSTLGQLRNAVESAIDAEQRSRKRALTRDEKASVMRGLIDRRVMVDRWGSDVTLPVVAVVSPTDRENSYVPVAQIPEALLGQWVNVIRSQFPREQTATREDIVRRYRDRIQKAHAAALMGLGADEERRRLEGR